MLRKIIDYLQSSSFSTIILVVYSFGLGIGLAEWYFNHTFILNLILVSLVTLYSLVLKLLKCFVPYYKSMKMMWNSKTIYDKLEVFYEKVLPERRKTIPKTIYKYVALSSDKTENEKRFATIENNQLWFSSVDNLNDPFEGYNCCYLKDFAFDVGLGNNIDERVLNWQKFIERIRHDFYICSFSKEKNIMPLWAHYTNNYCGFCVEYEVLDPCNMFEVEYWARKFDVGLDLERLQQEYLEFKIDREQIDHALLLLHWYICSMKSREWEYEKEVRIVSYIPNSSCVGQNEDCSRAGLKINKIIIGCNCSEENKERLEKIAKKLSITTEMAKFDYSGEFSTLENSY